MLVETISECFRKALSANATDSSFPSRVPTLTEPTTNVIDPGSPTGPLGQNGMLVMPYALGSDNDTFSVRVYGWRVVGTNPLTTLWIPCLLVELACTASTVTGVAGAIVLNTERFADTISLTTGNDDVSVDIVSPTGNVAAHAMLDLKGFQKFELTFQLGTTPTSMNALVSLL